jgi:polyphosphate kinase
MFHLPRVLTGRDRSPVCAMPSALQLNNCSVPSLKSRVSPERRNSAAHPGNFALSEYCRQKTSIVRHERVGMCIVLEISPSRRPRELDPGVTPMPLRELKPGRSVTEAPTVAADVSTTAKSGLEHKERKKLERKRYEKKLHKLQVELCHLQHWVKAVGAKVIIVFEGRDAAGKGGTIKAITERVSPRVFRVVALPAPSDREKTQMFMQRYIERFPAAGEIVIFDRSWYNRAGVDHVMGFASDEDYRRFLALCPEIEKYIIDGGIRLIKVWLEVGKPEQKRRFQNRISDPLRQWKLSDMDLESYKRWYQYSKARDMMLRSTDTKHAPWYIVRTDDKRRARLNCIAHILSLIPYKKMDRARVKLPKRSSKFEYDDVATLQGRRFVPEKY